MLRIPRLATALLVTALLVTAAAGWAQAGPVDIGSRLELFVDDFLIERVGGAARLALHRPQRREIVIVHDAPWEGNNSAYHTVFRDGDTYRMYYRGRQIDLSGDKLKFPHGQRVCYAESRDGLHWEKPALGLVEFQGSKENNIIWDQEGSHNFAPFKDPNPACPPEARYKALGGVKSEGGLYAFQSPDGIHWTKMQAKPVVTDGYFDSQNLAFWDSERNEYREYHREFRDGRDIKTSTSDNFLDWSAPAYLSYSPGRLTQLYTNQITPYYRAPHILLGFPTRYNTGRGLLTAFNERVARVHPRYGNDYTDGGFIAGRDRLSFKVWDEAFLRPGPVESGRWVYGANYQNWGLVETESSESGEPNEISVYASEGDGWEGSGISLRRYTLRIDGFVSLHAPLRGGELLTKIVKFSGSRLVVNFATSAAGGVKVEIQDDKGRPVEGFSLADSVELFGDSIEKAVAWKDGGDLSTLAGKPVRLRFVVRDADLYSYQFR